MSICFRCDCDSIFCKTCEAQRDDENVLQNNTPIIEPVAVANIRVSLEMTDKKLTEKIDDLKEFQIDYKEELERRKQEILDLQQQKADLSDALKVLKNHYKVN